MITRDDDFTSDDYLLILIVIYIYIIGLSLSFFVLIHISIIIVPNVIGMFIFIAIVNIVGVVMHNG